MVRKLKIKQQDAFTLVEIMTVMVVISTISASLVVSFSQLASRRLDAQSRRLTEGLAKVREMSASCHSTFFVDFDVLNKSYTVYKDSVASANFVERLNLDVDSITISPAPASAQFDYPKGTSNAIKQIVLNSRGKTKQITIYPLTGYIK